jgi:hypothetical protein
MKNEIKSLVDELMKENHDRSVKMNDSKTSQYTHSALVNEYNNTLDIVKRLEKILSKY